MDGYLARNLLCNCQGHKPSIVDPFIGTAVSNSFLKSLTIQVKVIYMQIEKFLFSRLHNYIYSITISVLLTNGTLGTSSITYTLFYIKYN